MPSSFFWYPAPFLIQVTLKKKAFSKKAKIKGQRMLKGDPKFSDPNHLRGISPNCIDCIDPTWNRLAAANMQRPAANFQFQGRRSLTT